MIRARDLVERGAIGSLCGIESYYGFDLGSSPGARYFSQAYTHWAYQLPGGLLQNGLDHPLSVVVPFMAEPKRVMAASAEVGVLPRGVPGELRMILANDDLLRGDYAEAIKICRRAASQGWVGDWDKRIARCEKRSRA